MKSLFCLVGVIIVFAISACKKQAHITIEGLFKEGETAKITVKSLDVKICYDSVFVKNGKFSKSMIVPQDGFYLLDISSSVPFKFKSDPLPLPWMTSIKFYAENNSKYIMKIDNISQYLSEHNKYSLFSTSFTETKLNEFDQLIIRNKDSLNGLKEKYFKASEAFLADPVHRQKYFDTITDFENQAKNSWGLSLHQYIKSNNATIIVPYMISQANDLFGEYQYYKTTLEKLTPEVKKTEYYDDAINLLKSVENISKGTHIPSLYGNNLNGVAFNNEFKNNKLILINFWASWCIPCREEIPQLKQVYAEYKSKGFNIISVSIDEDDKAWRKASLIEKIPWDNIAEIVDQFKSKNIENFVVKSVPQNYLIKSNGELVNRDISVDSLARLLKKTFH